MKHLYSYATRVMQGLPIVGGKYWKCVLGLLVAASLFLPSEAKAQSPLPISDFVVYGKNAVHIAEGSSTSQINALLGAGRVGSLGSVRVVGQNTISSQINSGQNVYVGGSTTVTGRITAANMAGYISDTILNALGNSHLTNRLDINGGITIAPSTGVAGPVHQPAGPPVPSYSGPINSIYAPGGPIVFGNSVSLPILPVLPAATTFPPAGNINFPGSAATLTLTPGSYGNLEIDPNQTVVFNGGGTYVFNSITASNPASPSNTRIQFSFDHSNPENGIFRIYVHGQINLGYHRFSYGNTNASVPSLPIADMVRYIYTEVHQAGNAFTLGGGTDSEWAGTLYAPNGSISYARFGGPGALLGALYSGAEVRIGDDVALYYAPLLPQVLCATPPILSSGTTICQGTTAVLSTPPSAGHTYTWIASGGGTISSGANTNSITVSSGGVYTVYETDLTGCTAQATQFLTEIPSPTVSVSPPALTVCESILASAPVTLTANQSTALPLLDISWTTATGTITGPANGPTVQASAAGTYTVTLTATNGCQGIASSVLSESAAPEIVLSPSVTICGPALASATPVILTATVSHAADYTWTSGTGAILSSGGLTGAGPANVHQQITAADTYTLTVRNYACSPTAVETATVQVGVQAEPCIVPLITPPPADGKEEVIKGAELTSLATYFSAPGFDPEEVKDIFIISGDSVYVEVIAKPSKKAELLSSLLALGLTNIIENGAGSLVISGRFPIANLAQIDLLTTQVNYARPLFPALNNTTGLNAPVTQGDAIMRSDLVRSAYGLDGTGIKIGVISDSYNHLPNSPATLDISGGNLPGAGNPNGHGLAVQVLDDEALRRGTDEGRAMLQIVHDIAPKSELVFRTGCKTPGDMAEGIKQLQQAGCHIIVDDLTHITEPYYRDGQIARAVDYVTEQGTAYFTASGNFGSKAFEGTFAPATILPNLEPVIDNILGASFTGEVHDFADGSVFQDVVLKTGSYIVVLQWEDAVYTNGDLAGTQTDLDLYLVHNNAQSIIAYNRTNYGGDPLEVLSFEVTADQTPAKFLVAKAAGSAVKFKYIVFRGELALAGGALSDATVAGHANAEGAITVGAVRPPVSLSSNLDEYLDTGVIPMSYTSKGGTPVNNLARQKPDLAAPNGVLTTVRLGLDVQGNEQFYRFYGTSAAAPHAAAVGALLVQGRKKFLNQNSTSPAMLRSLLTQNTFTPGQPHNPLSGSGLLNAEAAIRAIANPKPQIANVVSPVNISPGNEISVIIEGSGFMETSEIFVDEQVLPLNKITSRNNNSLTALITPLQATSPIRIQNPSLAAPNDGGSSNTWFLGAQPKPKVTIVAHDKTKKFGQAMPAYSYTLLINDAEPDAANFTLANVGISAISLDAKDNNLQSVTELSPVNTAGYPIIPQVTYLPGSEAFDYELKPGLLRINKLPLKITPQNINLVYGQKIDTVELTYEFDAGAVLNAADMLAHVQETHSEQLTDTIAVVNTRVAVEMAALVNEYYVTDLGFLASNGALSNTRVAVEMAALVNEGAPDPNAPSVIDLPTESLLYYRDVSGEQVPLTNTRVAVEMAALVNTRIVTDMVALVNAGPLVYSNLTNTRVAVEMAALVNEGPTTRVLENESSLLNSGSAYTEGGRSNVAMIIDTADINIPNPAVTSKITSFASINVITGYTAGQHFIMPGALLSENFDITYGYGILTVAPAPLLVKTATVTRYIFKGDPMPSAGFSSPVVGWVGEDSVDLATPLVIQAIGPRSSVNPVPYSQVSGAAGIYDLVRIIDPGVSANYTVTTDFDSIFVNPKGPQAKQVKPKLNCVSKITTLGPNGVTYQYIAHMEYDNDNTEPVYLPSGNAAARNYITASGNYYADLPEVFLPGTHPVDVLFDGKQLRWNIKTFTSTHKTANAKGNAHPCNNGNSRSTNNTLAEPEISVYPNPTNGVVTLQQPDQKLSPEQVQVFDMLNRACQVNIAQNAGALDLDLTHLAQGIYLIKVSLNNTQQVLRVVKE